MLDGDEVVIVARSGCMARRHAPWLYGLHLGARLPAHPTSTGRVLLAALPGRVHAVAAGLRCGGSRPHRHAAQRPAQRWWPRCDAMILPGGGRHELGVHALAVPCNLPGAHGGGAQRGRIAPADAGANLQRDMLPLLREAHARCVGCCSPRGLAHAGLCGLSRHCLRPRRCDPRLRRQPPP